MAASRIATTIIAGPFAAAWLVLASILPGLAAEDYDPATRTALQSVITSQLDALEHDDAAKAESFASPGIQERFPEPSKFLDMVKQQYGALIHPKSTQFGETTASPHGPVQKVIVVAADGTVWSALYAFEKVKDDWRIIGCGLAKDDSQQEI